MALTDHVRGKRNGTPLSQMGRIDNGYPYPEKRYIMETYKLVMPLTRLKRKIRELNSRA
jgi:hypothetical protein